MIEKELLIDLSKLTDGERIEMKKTWDIDRRR